MHLSIALKAVDLFKEFGTADDVNDVIGNIGGVCLHGAVWKNPLSTPTRL